jgi:hypothetical protein
MIHLIWATARPDIFLRCHHTKWMETAKNKEAIKTYVIVDSQKHIDHIYNTKISTYYNSKKCNVLLNKSDTRGVAKPTNQAAQQLKTNDGDIIILASDDFEAPQGWDNWLNKIATEHDNKCIWVNDGFKPGGTITIPILTHKCFKSLNQIIYHPSYNHEWSDAELYDVLKEMDRLHDVRSAGVVFQHNHWANGKRKQDSVDGECRKLHHKDRANYMLRKHLTVDGKLKT